MDRAGFRCCQEFEFATFPTDASDPVLRGNEVQVSVLVPVLGDERRRLRERLRALPPEERKDVLGRLARIRSLPPDEQRRLQDRMAELRSLPKEELGRIRDNAEQWKSMSRDDRARLRSAYDRLRELPPDEQQRLLDRLLREDAP